MTKTTILAAVAATALLATACDKGGDGPDKGREPFVVNGTTWAARNVAAPGYFADNAEDYGTYYDFEAAQTACPDGWRTPTQSEWAALLSLGSNWTTENGIRGLTFRRGESWLFLPAAGLTHGKNITEYVGTDGYYWSGTTSNRYGQPTAWRARIGVYAGGQIYAVLDDGDLYDNGFSVRCVRGANEL